VEASEEFRVSVLSGGVSNRTVLVERASGSWVLKQALEQLRVPVEWFSDPARVHRGASGPSGVSHRQGQSLASFSRTVGITCFVWRR
jgi:hypothetical protein